MKKLVLLLFLTATVLITSCGNDDDNNSNNTQSRLVGNWKITQQGTELNGEELLFPYLSDAPECGDDTITFNANSTGVTVNFYLNQNDQCVEDSFPFAYSSIGENTLAINDDGDIVTAEILILTDTTLKLKTVEEYEGETEIVLLVLTKV